jgi:flavin reductase (DIM6/NTAB) family NADH-FMN oxidoreductase RutF
MNIRPELIPYRELYRILLSAVGPRPIAWVSTLSKDGVPNLAPFSFFNAVSAKPPMLGFAPAIRQLEHGHEPKGTLVNIRETGEFVVNIVTFELAEAMNVSSGEYEYGVNEFELAGLKMRASEVVRPPQVAASPVNFECKLHKILEFGTEPPSGSFVIGEIVAIHVEDSIVHEGKIDGNAIDLIGRMGGMQYARTTERFEMQRPKVKR